jgi:hypothetical protein
MPVPEHTQLTQHDWCRHARFRASVAGQATPAYLRSTCVTSLTAPREALVVIAA